MIPATSDALSGQCRSRFRRVCKWLVVSMGLIIATCAVFQSAFFRAPAFLLYQSEFGNQLQLAVTF
jgi:hypothetical protein